MFGLRLGAMGRVGSGLTLTQQAINVLRKPGLESHVYMPGVGWVNGLSLTNTIMEDGTQAASVDNPLGYVGDPIATVGLELVTNGDFSNGTTGWSSASTAPSSWTVTGGQLVMTADGTSRARARQTVTTVVGRSYQISVQLSNAELVLGTSAGGTQYANVAPTTGNIQLVFTATTTSLFVQLSSLFNGTSTADNISVRELVGAIPARQATTANKPILRRGAVNRATQSENILAASGYGVNGGGTLTRNQTAPNGTTTASLFTEGVTAASAHFITNPAGPAFNAGAIYTQTWFVKAGTATRCQITFPSAPFGTAQYANFGLTGAGSVLASAGGTASIALDEQGFYRCRFTATCSTTGTGNASILAFINSDVSSRLPNYTGTDLTLTVWGVQTETGSTASPYVPTTTAAASSNIGPFWAEYDGTDFLSLASVPFQIQDDCVVVFGALPINAALANQQVLSIRSLVAPPNGLINIGYEGTSTRFITNSNDGTTSALNTPASGSSAVGVPIVVSFRKTGNTRTLRNASGAWTNTSSTVLANSTSVTGAAIGNDARTGVNQQFVGGIYSMLVIKGTITDAELATLERWVAQASGVTL